MAKDFRTMCITLYNDDIRALEKKVRELKKRGYPRMNKSMLIRLALRELDVNDVEIPERV